MIGIPYAFHDPNDHHFVICPVCGKRIRTSGTKDKNYAKHYAKEHAGSPEIAAKDMIVPDLTPMKERMTNKDADAPMRARVAGREAVSARTAWSLDIGGFRLRCVRVVESSSERYEVQSRSGDRWQRLAESDDAMRALLRVVGGDGALQAMRDVCRSIDNSKVGAS